MDTLFSSMAQDLQGTKHQPENIRFLKAVLVVFDDERLTTAQINQWTNDGFVVFTQKGDLLEDIWHKNRQELKKAYAALPFYAIAPFELQDKVVPFIDADANDYQGLIFVRDKTELLPESSVENITVPLGFITNDPYSKTSFLTERLWVHYERENPWDKILPMVEGFLAEHRTALMKTKRGALRYDRERMERE